MAWTPRMLLYFHHFHLNLCYANEVSSGQVSEVNRLFIEGRERNVGSKPVQWGRTRKGISAPAAQPDVRVARWAAYLRAGATKGEDSVTLCSGRADGRAKGAKVLPPSESETGKQTCWTKIIHVSSLRLQES